MKDLMEAIEAYVNAKVDHASAMHLADRHRGDWAVCRDIKQRENEARSRLADLLETIQVAEPREAKGPTAP